jgi:hypothetical protein
MEVDMNTSNGDEGNDLFGFGQDLPTGLAAHSAALHEMFTEHVKAGFTQQQALYLVGQFIQALVSNADGE